MLNVTEEQIEAYNSNSIHKTLIIKFPSVMQGNVDPRNIISESMTLKEMLLDGKNVEFVGCNSSEFTIKIRNLYQDVKNKRIEVAIKTDDTDEIPLFKGYVYSAKRDDNTDVKTVKAYDILYQKGQIDVAQWYQQLVFPITLKALRESLFAYIELPYEQANLPNDNIVIDRQYEPQTLKCLSVLKGLCQINGCFGIINRDEKFVFRFLEKDSEVGSSNQFNFAKKITREEFYVKPFNKVVIRKSENDAGVSVGYESDRYNKYIIQANMFAYKLDDASLHTVATNILDTISGISFVPVETNNNGMPFVEVGDTVSYRIGNARATNSYRVLNRELNGIQALRDVYGADGDEEASEYITDLQTQIDTIKQSGGGGDMDDVYTKEEADDLFPTFDATYDIVSDEVQALETPTGFTVVSSYALPSTRRANTIYLIQGGVIIV